MNIIQNPILKGFNPDPSIIRVGKDYYIATSTFEWFPGVQIHHSRDLVDWELVSRPLDRLSQLDLRGVPDSCGVWAPCLSYDEGTYYLVYSNVKSFDGVWKDTPNYLVTSDKVDGVWSEPIFLSSAGFDGSLFHDEDGRKWYLSMLVDHRAGKFFGGIILQEYSAREKRLIGEPRLIFEGTDLGKTEGPHLYKIKDYYYLLTAEGGTEYGHAVTIARSKNITGPYEVHPHNPLLSSRNDPKAILQKTGHGDLFQTQEGDWGIVYLCGRPLTERGRCILGRETAIEMVAWKDDWPYLSNGSKLARVEVELPQLSSSSSNDIRKDNDFGGEVLDPVFQSLRVPVSDEWISLKERKGWLRLYGRQSLSSIHDQSFIARRIQDFHTVTSTCVDFNPGSFQQMAGLVYYYNTEHFFYLFITTDNGKDRVLKLLENNKGNFIEHLEHGLNLVGGSPVYLKGEFKYGDLQFYYGQEENKWEQAGPVLDGSILSDDYVLEDRGKYRPAFTGAFVGLACQDLSGSNRYADFDWFKYKEIQEA